MTKSEIMNTYAIEQGYESWRELTEDYAINGNILTYKYLDHQNAVTDLIQEELKSRIAEIEDIYLEDFNEFGDAYAVIGTIKESILNTEIL